MPGLFDVHTHLDNPTAMRRALDSNVTTVRSASVPAFQDVGFREMVRAGALHGPDVVATGYDADLILLPGNPLEDVMALQDVLMVVSNGRIALKRIRFGLD